MQEAMQSATTSLNRAMSKPKYRIRSVCLGWMLEQIYQNAAGDWEIARHVHVYERDGVFRACQPGHRQTPLATGDALTCFRQIRKQPLYPAIGLRVSGSVTKHTPTSGWNVVRFEIKGTVEHIDYRLFDKVGVLTYIRLDAPIHSFYPIRSFHGDGYTFIHSGRYDQPLQVLAEETPHAAN